MIHAAASCTRQWTVLTASCCALTSQDSQDKKKGSGPALVRCGSCATVCLVVGNQAYVANLGDSSCVLYRRTAAGGALAEMLSVDHKARAAAAPYAVLIRPPLPSVGPPAAPSTPRPAHGTRNAATQQQRQRQPTATHRRTPGAAGRAGAAAGTEG